MRHSRRALVRILVTLFSMAAITAGASIGGNPFGYRGGGTGNGLIFVGALVLSAFWILVWCSWYSGVVRDQSESADVSSRLQHGGPYTHSAL
jgi:hypothetical protein